MPKRANCILLGAGPWLISVANAALRGELEAQQSELAAAAVENLQALGPTFVKLGQIMSVRWGFQGCLENLRVF
jgi:predicted unusual protein kinase regulating ubiquinone biosynthesis (AarF/ABC1/UbiB family)